MLDINDFGKLCCALFRNDRGCVYPCPPERQREMFDVFDENKDGFIDKSEFKFCWNRWIKKIVRPVSVLLVIDVQNDFISGSLNLSNCAAQHNGEEIIKPINELLDTVRFDAMFYSFDWHPADHVSFIDNLPQRKIHSSSPLSAAAAQLYDTVIFEGSPPVKQRLWPRHCVMDGAVFVYKGINTEVDSYSAFFDNQRLSRTCLDDRLRELNATDVYVCGLAYDVCVGATAVDALNLGYRTVLIDDCCRGVNVDDIEATKSSFIADHGIVVDSQQVKAMVDGRDRRPEMGYKLCIELRAEKKRNKI
ncbi:hypothetical protein B566_EDAN008362 [Ephemera danica]|nr:hypothetical protein B566_EDAN008362 [Ephemera danica]